MKKLLLATTILVGTAGFAAAEVTLSGDARMGIAKADTAGDANFTSRARVSFGLSGESDSGLSFGASFRADNASSAESGTAGSAYISGAFGKLSMGDVDGAAAAAVGQVDGVGLTGLGDGNELTYIAGGGFDNDDLLDADIDVSFTNDPSALYEFSTGAVTVYASVTNPGYEADGDDDTSVTLPVDGIAYAIGAVYSTDTYKAAIGYENLTVTIDGDDYSATQTVIGGDATFGAVTVKARYGVASGDDEAADRGVTQYALSATYAADAMSATIYTRNVSADDASILDVQTMGLGASYDLGGGAKVVGGVARISDNNDDDASGTVYDLGVSFSF